MKMLQADVDELASKTLSLLRVSSSDWEIINYSRRRGSRFSLNFPHEIAKEGQQGGLVLVSVPEPEPALAIGMIRSKGATATFDTRVAFDWVSPVQPGSLKRLLESVTAPALRAPCTRLVKGEAAFERISPKLAKEIIGAIAAEPDNGQALFRILACLRRPALYNNVRALQHDALALAIKVFGGAEEAVSIALSGDDTAIATVRVLEDAAIEHDARWIPGWRLIDSDLTGRATFQGGVDKLDVFTANKRPLEKLLGVDLIYANKNHNSLIMVQYKILESQYATKDDQEKISRDDDNHKNEWIVRIDKQFKKEISRMRRFDRDLAPDGPYRLNSEAFFFKLIRRNSSTKSASYILSLGHLDHLIANGGLAGKSGGLRISYQGLAGQYLRGEGFVELVRSGYIGTRGDTTEHLQTLIEASLKGGNAVVAGIQSALEDKDSMHSTSPDLSW